MYTVISNKQDGGDAFFSLKKKKTTFGTTFSLRKLKHVVVSYLGDTMQLLEYEPGLFSRPNSYILGIIISVGAESLLHTVSMRYCPRCA